MRSARRLSHPAVVLTIAAVISLARSARADDELATCTTHSARSADEIIVPLSDDPNDPPGVTIAPGETLCIAGSLGRENELRPHLVDRDERALVLVRLALEGDLPVLHVRTRRGQWLSAHIDAIVGPANLPTLVGVLREPRDGPDLRMPLPKHDRWLLSHWWLQEARPIRLRPRPPPRSPPSPEHRFGDMGITALAGTRRLALGGFDAPLRASGYAPFPRMLPSFGIAAQLAIKRWRFDVEIQRTWATARALAADSHLDASFAEVLLDFGYDFLHWRGLTGFVLGGFGGGNFTIDTGGPNWTYLAATAKSLGGASQISKDIGRVALQTGFQEILPLSSLGAATGFMGFALTLSVQGGYALQLGRPRAWSVGPSRSDVDGPPEVDLSGTWLFFGIGGTVWGV